LAPVIQNKQIHNNSQDIRRLHIRTIYRSKAYLNRVYAQPHNSFSCLRPLWQKKWFDFFL